MRARLLTLAVLALTATQTVGQPPPVPEPESALQRASQVFCRVRGHALAHRLRPGMTRAQMDAVLGDLGFDQANSFDGGVVFYSRQHGLVLRISGDLDHGAERFKASARLAEVRVLPVLGD